MIETIRQAYPDHARGGIGALPAAPSTPASIRSHGTTNYFSWLSAVRGLDRAPPARDDGCDLRPDEDEFFTGSRGAARSWTTWLRVARRAGLAEALIGTGFPFKELAHLDDFLRIFKAVTNAAGVRRAGAAALAYVAAGRSTDSGRPEAAAS